MSFSRYEISDNADELNQEIDDTNFPRSSSLSNGNGSLVSLNNSVYSGSGGTTAFAARRRSSSLRKTESETLDDELAAAVVAGADQAESTNGGAVTSNGVGNGSTTRPELNRAQSIRTTSFSSGEVFESGNATHGGGDNTVPSTPRTTLAP
ncbi:GTP cyclohydrolase 1-like, partial [Uranotaenia lowii]|uniref:GTP cyclohydrolase 1-like n=1 Tax=Uranotaenia lowii TaxID=190385 RepID=UPI0024796140